jgi:hypothetical protein
MTEKLEILEERVRETVEGAQSSVEEMVEKVRYTVDTTVETMKQTVEGAQSSVEDIVENVRGTVGETVETVQRIFDLHHQMEQHPWLILSGSLLVGYLLGSGGMAARRQLAPSLSQNSLQQVPPLSRLANHSPVPNRSRGQEAAYWSDLRTKLPLSKAKPLGRW